MTWLLILAMWNTNPPQQSFKFLTSSYKTQQECEAAIQDAYAALFNRGFQGQAICQSVDQLKLEAPISY
jgi:hypothetical protein